MRAFIEFNKGIMKMPLPWRLWLMLLVTMNLAVPLFFLDRREAQFILGALLVKINGVCFISVVACGLVPVEQPVERPQGARLPNPTHFTPKSKFIRGF